MGNCLAKKNKVELHVHSFQTARVANNDSNIVTATWLFFLYTIDKRYEEVPDNVTHVKIDSSIQELQSWEFSDFQSLLHCELPEDCLILGKHVFEDCKSLQGIAIPASVKELRESAFKGCRNLSSVEFKEGITLTHIESYTFLGCESLSCIQIPSSVTVIENGAFEQCWKLVVVELEAGLEYIGANVFRECTSLINISVPYTVKEIGHGAFSQCHSLTFVHLSEGLEIIGEGAFFECILLKRITLPSTVIQIETQTFQRCASLVSIILSEELISIGEAAFHGCSELKNIMIPASVESIGLRAFANCTKLCNRFPEDDFGAFTSFSSLGLSHRLVSAIGNRFDGFPVHRYCYYHAHEEIPAKSGSDLNTVIGSDLAGKSNSHRDKFGMTPLHILALSANPNFDLWKMVADEFEIDLQRKDGWGQCPIDYLIENEAPGSLDLLKHGLRLSIDRRLHGLGLERWKSEILNTIDQIQQDGFENRRQMFELTNFLLSKYEMMEILSLLELVVWKAEMLELISSGKYYTEPSAIIGESKRISLLSPEDRTVCKISCGVGVIISNVLPFLAYKLANSEMFPVLTGE